MAKKGPMPNYETIDAYIADQSEEAQQILSELQNDQVVFSVGFVLN